MSENWLQTKLSIANPYSSRSPSVGRTLRFIMLLSFLTLVPHLDARACGCFPSIEATTGKKMPVRTVVLVERKKAKAIFSGKVVSIDVEKNAYLAVKFKVDRSWKFVNTEEITVNTAPNESMCGYTFEVGQSYLVYAGDVHGELWTNHCTRTGRLTVDVHEDLRILGKGRVPRRKQPHGNAP